MARTASTTRNEVEARVSVFDIVYLVAENRGSMLTQKQIGEVLFRNESQIQQAMKDAAMAYLKTEIYKMAGITVRELSDEVAATNERTANALDMSTNIDITEAIENAIENSASLEETTPKTFKANKR